MNKYHVYFIDGFTDTVYGSSFKQACEDAKYNALRRIMIVHWEQGVFHEDDWMEECAAYFIW